MPLDTSRIAEIRMGTTVGEGRKRNAAHDGVAQIPSQPSHPRVPPADAADVTRPLFLTSTPAAVIAATNALLERQVSWRRGFVTAAAVDSLKPKLTTRAHLFAHPFAHLSAHRAPAPFSR